MLKVLSSRRFPPIVSMAINPLYCCLVTIKIAVLQQRMLRASGNKIISFLQEKGVECRQGTHAVHCQHYYQNKYGLRKEDFPNSYLAQEATLALPLYPQMSDEEQDYVIQELKKALEILF